MVDSPLACGPDKEAEEERCGWSGVRKDGPMRRNEENENTAGMLLPIAVCLLGGSVIMSVIFLLLVMQSCYVEDCKGI